MRVRTLDAPETKPEIQNEIQQHVDERGFYLYEWITPDELRMSVQADYLSIVKRSSIPLAVITLIAGIVGLGLGPLGVFLGVLGVLLVFYGIVFLILVMKMIRRSYIYTRGADVVITDEHYVTGGRIIEKSDFSGQKEAFHIMEQLFREPLFERSNLKDYIAIERKSLFEKLKEIAYGGGKVIEKLGRSRDSGGIILALVIAGILYGVMMALVYFIGVFFVMIGANLFSWIAHKILLATNNLEHHIQTLFVEITEASRSLKDSKKSSISLLTEAGQNAWKENLSGRLEASFLEINTAAKKATEKSIDLRRKLEKSQYSEIFNFTKYGNWTKKQILEPIEEIIALLEKNMTLLESTIVELDRQITDTSDPSLQKPLMLQKERLELQMKSLESMTEKMKQYQEKLSH